MAKTKINYVCTQCGAIQPKWMGKCPDCGSWNTLVENVEAPVSRFASSAVPQTAKSTVQKLEQIDSSEEQRYLTQMEELNRVLGGGIVPGSVVTNRTSPAVVQTVPASIMMSSWRAMSSTNRMTPPAQVPGRRLRPRSVP